LVCCVSDISSASSRSITFSPLPKSLAKKPGSFVSFMRIFQPQFSFLRVLESRLGICKLGIKLDGFLERENRLVVFVVRSCARPFTRYARACIGSLRMASSANLIASSGFFRSKLSFAELYGNNAVLVSISDALLKHLSACSKELAFEQTSPRLFQAFASCGCAEVYHGKPCRRPCCRPRRT